MKEIFIFLFVVAIGVVFCNNEDEQKAKAFLEKLNERCAKRNNRLALANWAYASNITDENLQQQLNVSAQVAKETKDDWNEVIKFNWQQFNDKDLLRQFQKYSILGISALPEDKYKKLKATIGDMQKIYSTAKICSFANKTECNLALEPELTDILKKSRNPEELKHIWTDWHKSVGPHVKNMFEEYVQLSNEAARLNNFTNTGEYWLESYETADIKQQIEELWQQVKPLYLQIHAYVRHQLRKKYGKVVTEKGPIPAHLLGNMWAQTWANIGDFSVPYPGKTIVDISDELVKQNYTPTKIFKTAEEFFVSLNLSAMPDTFWKNSILEKPKDREIVCHASAWDFYDGKDFRIKQCTKPTGEHFKTAHHEMGHIQYYLQYKHLPVKYRRGANSGFHEAVGDVIALSVQTTKHLRKLGLLKSQEDDPEAVLNYLYQVGLSKIVFLPFSYTVDQWRWSVFEGNTTPENYNCKWWELRQKYQGVEAPVDRSEDDFDAAAKYHVVADVPYIRYFVSFIIQFQFHRALCEKAGQYGATKPLHECDIHGSVAAGKALGDMLQLGASKPWPEALEILTGQRKMDAGGLLEYFKPLHDFLLEYNKKNNVFVGWEASRRECHPAAKKT